MSKEQLQDLINKGYDAQDFLRVFNEGNQYYKNLFVGLDKELTDSILGLDPKNAVDFTILQSKRMALYEPINRIRQDIDAGKKAQELIEDVETTGGIL